MVGVYFIQQSHDFFAQAERSGVAGRRRAVRQPHKAEEAHEGGESQPHVGYDEAAVALLRTASSCCDTQQCLTSKEEDLLQF